MGKINVVRDDGSVVSVDEATYQKSQEDARPAQRETLHHSQARRKGEQEAAKSDSEGIAGSVMAGLMGAADTALLGVPGLINKKLAESDNPSEWGPEFRHDDNLLARHSTAHGVGSFAGYLTPGSLPVALGSKVGAKVTSAVGSKLVGRAAEGAIGGVVGHVVHTNATGDPLSVEGAIQGAGLGALLNIGFGALGDKFKKSGAAAKAEKETADALKTRGESVLKDKAAFESSAAYSEAHTAYSASAGPVRATKKAQAAWDATKKEYDSWIDPAGYGNKIKAATKEAEGMINSITRRPGYSESAVVKAPPKPTMNPKFDLTDELAPQFVDGASTVASPTAEVLKGYRDRVSTIYKKLGSGYKADGGAKWSQIPGGRAPDYAGALEDLRTLLPDMAGHFPKASARFKKLPSPQSTPRPLDVVTLPKRLKEFGAMRTETVAKLANSADEATVGAFERLSLDIGEGVKGTPAETILGVHQRLKSVLSGLDEATAAATTETTKASSGLGGWIRKFARGAAGLSLGRIANTVMGGGWKGATAQVAAGNAARSAMTGAEDALLGNVMVIGKETLRSKVRNVVAKYGEKTGAAVEKMGPVTGYLATAFPSGKADLERDPRKQAVNRTKEIADALVTGPDAMFLAVEGMLGHPADLGWKVHAQVMTSLQVLAGAMPKDPGLNMKMGVSAWTPSHRETVAFAHVMEAVLSPGDAVTRVLSGDGHPAAIDALWAANPAFMAELAAEVSMTSRGELTYEKASEYSQLFRTPLTALQEPEIALTIQGMYLPREEVAAGGGNQAKAPGRPAAVQSKVAGSSVSALTA